MIEFDVLTIFPRLFDSYLKESLINKARDKGIIKINVLNIRDFASLPHKKVDDRPFGGGPGMVLKFEPIYKALNFILRKKVKKTKVVLFSLRGKKFNSQMAKKLLKSDRLILICGRYEGVDERVAKYLADMEISIGDYVLNGGELAAEVLIEAVSRFRPGFLGKEESLEEIKGSYPVYTRPAEYKIGKKNLKVPKVLLSGNHKKISLWRKKLARPRSRTWFARQSQ